MSLSIGIVGLPNVGKSTLFEALTKKQVDKSNYPFCTIEPNVGVVAVSDERVDKLAALTKSVKKIYAMVEFVDIAGLVEGANKGEGLGNQFLARIREVDAVLYVLRGFLNEKIITVRNEINPLKEKEILDTELALKDLDMIEKRMVGLEKEIRARKKEAIKEKEILTKAKVLLEQGKILAEQSFNNEEKEILKNYQFLTLKPRLYVLNSTRKEINREVLEIFEKNNWLFLIIDILEEFGSSGFNLEERLALGLVPDSALDVLIKKSYELLGLITFFTTGADETRAWTLKKGMTAPQAGGAIHSDFEKKFIKAEVINWQTLSEAGPPRLGEAGGFSQAKEKGLLRIEGKEYIIQDGDVIVIKHGV